MQSKEAGDNVLDACIVSLIVDEQYFENILFLAKDTLYMP
jgi:hypothetical protein